MTELKLARSPELSGFGGLLRFARSPLASFAEAFERHGEAVEFAQMRHRYLLLSAPHAIESVLLAKHGEFIKDKFTRDLTQVLGAGLVTNEGEAWRKQRKLVAPAFQPREIEGYVDITLACTDAALDDFRDGQVRDARADMMRLTLDVVVKALFGARFTRFAEVERCLESITRDYEKLWQSWRAVLPRWFPLWSRGHLRRTRRQLDAMLLEIIREKRKQPADDLLSRLIALEDEDGEHMSDRELIDETMTLFLAGHETSALALTYALHLLSQNPESYGALCAEIDGVLGARPPTLADLGRLRFTQAVLREAMRLYPPVWAMGREATRDLEIEGLAIRKGTQVLMPQWVVQRDPRWFKEPERFRPERWLNDECAQNPRFSYFPFGGGPRVCVGQHFALLEASVALARVSQFFRFERERPELDLAPVVTLRPRAAVEFTLRKRSPRLDLEGSAHQRWCTSLRTRAS